MRCWKATRVFSLTAMAACLVASAFSQTVVEPQVAAPGMANGNAPVAQVTFVNAPTATDRDKLHIGPGDLVEISLYGVPDFRQETRISDAGEISLPLVGSVNIGGSTVEEAQDKIEKSLVTGGYFREPHVMLLVKDFASQGVSVMGEVYKPGVYPAMSTRRLYDLVSMAGGFTPKAGKMVTITHRDHPEVPDKVILTSDPAKSIDSNVAIYPGDTIVVSKAGIIYVVGDVTRPGGYVMENNERMTVLEAIALAGGVNRTAALNAGRVIRRTDGKPEEVKIQLKTIMAAKSEDLELMPEDILFIPGSAAKNAARRGLDSVIQIATGMAVLAR